MITMELPIQLKHVFVDDKEKNFIKSYKFECRSCGNNNLKELSL